MDNFIAQHKGPLIAVGSAAIGLLLLLIISALANIPEDISFINIFTNLIWLLFIGGLLVVGFLYLRERFDYEYDEEDLYDQMPLLRSGTASEIVPAEHNLIKEEVVKLFGTADMQQVTKAVEAMYGELEELRTTGPTNNKAMISKLSHDLQKAQAASQRWEAKAISSTQEIEQLRQEIKEYGKWRPLNDKQVAAFLPTVTLRDGESENAFLESKRRQRRLMQRLNAEGYSIVCPVK